jgi:hypothetical protein
MLFKIKRLAGHSRAFLKSEIQSTINAAMSRKSLRVLKPLRDGVT